MTRVGFHKKRYLEFENSTRHSDIAQKNDFMLVFPKYAMMTCNFQRHLIAGYLSHRSVTVDKHVITVKSNTQKYF